MKILALIKDTILKLLGYPLLILGIFVFIVGLGMLFDKDPEDAQNALSIMIFSGAFLLPAIILILLGRKASREEEQLKSIASIIKSYRRITLSDLAGKLHIPIPQAEKCLSKALSLNLINGNFDRTTGEFFTEDARAQKLEFRFCPGCGAPLDRVYLEGETVKCMNCGFLMV